MFVASANIVFKNPNKRYNGIIINVRIILSLNLVYTKFETSKKELLKQSKTPKLTKYQ